MKSSLDNIPFFYTGYVNSDKQMADLIPAADIFVFPPQSSRRPPQRLRSGGCPSAAPVSQLDLAALCSGRPGRPPARTRSRPGARREPALRSRRGWADLLQRAAVAAVDASRAGTGAVSPRLSPLLSVLAKDGLLVSDRHPDRSVAAERLLACASTTTRGRSRGVPASGGGPRRGAPAATELTAAIGLRRSRAARRSTPAWLLQPASSTPWSRPARHPRRAAARAGPGPARARPAPERFELLCALRRRVAVVETRSDGPLLSGRNPPVADRAVEPPYDFASPRRGGVLGPPFPASSTTSPTSPPARGGAQEGRMAEEKALQFMYIFQSQVDQIAAAAATFESSRDGASTPPGARCAYGGGV